MSSGGGGGGGWWDISDLTKFLLEIECEKFRPPTIPTIRFRLASKNISRNHRGDKFHIGRIRTSDWKELQSHLPSRRRREKMEVDPGGMEGGAG